MSAVWLSALTVFAQTVGDSLITLKECWRYGSAIVDTQPSADANNVYLAEQGGRVSAISLTTGTRIWSTELGGEVSSDLVTDSSNVFVISSDASNGTHLRSLSVASGIPNWELQFPAGRRSSLAVAAGKLIVLADETEVLEYRSGGSKPEWSITFPEKVAGLFVGSGRVFVATADHKLHSIDVVSGKDDASYSSAADIMEAAPSDDGVVIGDSRGNVTMFTSGSRSWRFRNGARTTSLQGTPRGIIAASADNFVYLLSDYNGSVKWKKRMSARIANVTVAGDLAVVTTVGDKDAVFIDLETGKVVGTLALNTEEYFVRSPLFTGGKFIFFTTERVFAASQTPCSLN